MRRLAGERVDVRWTDRSSGPKSSAGPRGCGCIAEPIVSRAIAGKCLGGGIAGIAVRQSRCGGARLRFDCSGRVQRRQVRGTREELDHSTGAIIAQRDPKLIGPKSIELASNKASILKLGNPSGEHRFGSDCIELRQRNFPVSKSGCQKLQEDVPRGIREEPFAEYTGTASPDVQDRPDPIFCNIDRPDFAHLVPPLPTTVRRRPATPKTLAVRRVSPPQHVPYPL